MCLSQKLWLHLCPRVTRFLLTQWGELVFVEKKLNDKNMVGQSICGGSRL